MSGTICGEQMQVIAREPTGSGWCFRCRKRRDFVAVVSAPVNPMSYYGPSLYYECDAGHVDGDLFPGRSREW